MTKRARERTRTASQEIRGKDDCVTKVLLVLFLLTCLQTAIRSLRTGLAAEMLGTLSYCAARSSQLLIIRSR